MKIGITGFTENNLSSIFESYDTEKAGKINYKDFIGMLYNNPSIMDNPEKLKQTQIKKQDYPYAPTPSQSRHEEQQKDQNFNSQQQQGNLPRNQNLDNLKRKSENKNVSVDNIIETIRNKVKRRGIRCLISLENNFRALDDDNSQTPEQNFNKPHQ